VFPCADDCHAVDREPFSATPERFGNRRIDLCAELIRLLACHVVEGELIHVHRHDVHTRGMAFSVEAVTLEQPAHEDVGVRVRKVSIDNRRDAGPSRLPRNQR
jgi:hypothetical protein